MPMQTPLTHPDPLQRLNGYFQGKNARQEVVGPSVPLISEIQPSSGRESNYTFSMPLLMDDPAEPTAEGVYLSEAPWPGPVYVAFFGGYITTESASQATRLELALLRDGLRGQYAWQPYWLQQYEPTFSVPWGRHNEVLFVSK